jgi:hypothetical protein
MAEESFQEGASDDAAAVSTAGEGSGAADTKGAPTAGAEASKAAEAPLAAGDGKGAGAPAVAAKGATLAAGADVAADDAAKAAETDKAAKPYWDEKWREKIAEHVAAGDKKVFDKELKRLQRIADPAGIYGMYRELEGRFTGGGLVKLPGKDSKPEEVAAFHKALGVPEKAEDYFKDLQLENGAVIGADDKPFFEKFAADMHQVGMTPEQMKKAASWYYKDQEDRAARQDEADDTFRREAETKLKEELGPSYKRVTSAISSIFAAAPGGSDPNNPSSLFNRLLSGRTSDGRVIGNDPDMVRFLASMVQEINPEMSVVEPGNQGGMSIDAELAQIDKSRRENRAAYNKDYKMQARERELIEAQMKIQSRQRA